MLYGKEAVHLSILRKVEPRKRAIDVRRTMPLTYSMEKFFEDFPQRRWMETFEPFGWKRPAGIEYERAFRLDIVDREKEFMLRAELPCKGSSRKKTKRKTSIGMSWATANL